MPEIDPRTARKEATLGRLRAGSFDAEGLNEFSLPELIELSTRSEFMRIPEIRLGLQLLIQVRQGQELTEHLTQSVGALEKTVTTSAASAEKLSRSMVGLNRWVVVLSVVMALAAVIQIGQAIAHWLHPSPAPPATEAVRPGPRGASGP